MFGHHNDQKQQDQNENTEEQAPETENTPAAAPEQPSETVAPDTPAAPDASDTATDIATDDQPAVSDDPSWQHPGTPVEDTKISDVVSPAGGFPRSTGTQVASHHPTPKNDDDDLVNPADSELIDIRQNALSELAPLVNELDLEPEEKFRTLMMVIQASDDQKLVKDAYAAAHAIKDEKVRAQALYDIVNEINYFTAPQSED